MSGTIALSGDAILNRRVSTLEDPGLEAVAEVFRDADVGVTHFESLVHDFEGEGVYAPAEPGEMAVRSPAGVVDDLRWLGVDLVSHASNHALDYGYGGLRSTWAAMAERDLPIAGTGENLADARSPVFLDAAPGRVALVSATTSFTRWSRAGAARPDHRGRPGVNPLGYHHAVDGPTLATVKTLARQLGYWVTELADGEWAVHPPGLHNTLTRFTEADGDVDGARMIADEGDRAGNHAAIRDADRQADIVIAHLHTHAWDPDGTLADPPAFVREFAREAVGAGADVVLAQGSHAPLRPIEFHDGAPIIHDPGDLFTMVEGVSRQPQSFYDRFAHALEGDPRTASIADVYDARPAAFHTADHPPGGYDTDGPGGFVVPVVGFDAALDVERVTLHPGTIRREPVALSGVPALATGADAEAILERVADLSAPYGTDVRLEDGVGIVER